MSMWAVIRTASGLSIILAASAWINAQEPIASGAPKAPAPKSSTAQETPAQAVGRLAEQLKRNPVQPKDAPDRFGLSMMDVSNGEATLLALQPGPGLTQCGSPVWSHDGRRIVLDATPGREYRLSRLESIDLVEGRLKITDLGTGNCPTFSPADDRIAFLSNADDGERGVWMMAADGSGRRFLGDYGRPAWSPDGRQLMIIGFGAPGRVTLMDANPDKSGLLRLPGQQMYAFPSWAGVGTIVAAIGVTEADTVALIDVSDPSQAKVKEVLWRRENGPDVTPSESIYSATTRRCIFVGSGAKGVALYSIEQGQAGVAKRLGLGGYHPAITSLAESPDGRYILYHVHRPPPGPGLALARRDAAKEVADDNLDESEATKKIETLGGRIRRQHGSKQKNKPVTSVTISDRSDFRDADIPLLRSFKKLETLTLFTQQITDAGLRELKGLDRLVVLDVRSNLVTDDGLKELNGLKSLTRLFLVSVPITDQGLKHVGLLKNLEFLNLFATKITDVGLKEINELQRLTALVLGGTAVTDAGLQEVAKLRGLKSLNLYGCHRITDDCAKWLAELKQLEDLNLGATPITNDVINALRKPERWRSLDLINCTGITDASAATLGKMQNLRMLNLGGTGITDDGLKELKGLKNLKELDLSRSAVSDIGMLELTGLKNLTRLNLAETNVTEEGLKPFIKAVPAAKISR